VSNITKCLEWLTNRDLAGDKPHSVFWERWWQEKGMHAIMKNDCRGHCPQPISEPMGPCGRHDLSFT